MYKIFLAFMVSVFIFIPEASALSAQSSILIDGDSGRVLMEENAYVRRGMASTTKIMTAVIALEYGNLDDIVTVSRNAANVEGSSMWLKEGEQLPLESLLYGLMLNSGNDAATAISEHVGGSIEGFAKLMNDKAQALGLKDTSFVNPHGLDDENHYTTAYDLAQITRYALDNEKFAEIVASKTKTVKSENETFARTLKNHNKMLTLYDNADGVKTGFTKKSGRCLVSSATRDDMQMVAVTLNAPDDWNDHTEMLNFGFAKFTKNVIMNKGSHIKTIMVEKGTSKHVALKASRDVVIAVSEGETTDVKYNIPDKITAPVIIGQTVGTIDVYLNGNKITTVDAVASYGVAKKVHVRLFDIYYYLVLELLSNFARV